MEIKNVEDLRIHAIKLLNKLENKKIDMAEATATAKVYESILATAKTQMMYAQMNGETVKIKFLENGTNRVIEHSEKTNIKQLGNKK